MQFNINRDQLLNAIQLVIGVVERKQTLAVLGNFLINIENNTLSITGSDSEVQIQVSAECETVEKEGETTVPARKLFDIARSLPENCIMKLTMNDGQMIIKADQSKFVLSTLPARDFPSIEIIEAQSVAQVVVGQQQLKSLINKTSFAMAIQDVRYYLNGTLFELNNNELRLVTTDGHRLAMAAYQLAQPSSHSIQNILPRKATLELEKLLEENGENITIIFTDNVFSIKTNTYNFISKLIDGKFPDYNKVIPEASVGEDRILECDRQQLKQTFLRVAILSNEKYRGVKLNTENNVLTISASNPSQEEADEKINVSYSSDQELKDTGFNVSYLLDVISAGTSPNISIKLADNNSALIEQNTDDMNMLYVVMPMRL